MFYKYKNRKAGCRLVNKTENTYKQEAMTALTIEIKLSINNSLFEKGYITEEMYTRAKELILKQAA